MSVARQCSVAAKILCVASQCCIILQVSVASCCKCCKSVLHRVASVANDELSVASVAKG